MKTSIREQKKKHNRKRLILICLLFIFLFPFADTFSRYTIDSLNEFFGKTKEFYFYSDKLGENNPKFLIDNWSGVDDYPITINMNSRKNNILSATYDIEYDISYTCSSNAICTLSKTSGKILADGNSDFFTIKVTPNTKLEDGDEVVINVTATANSTYESELTGEFVLRVGKEDITYGIDDSEGSSYLELNITNTKSFYIVDEAFDDKAVGDSITITEYLSLSDADKEKCHCAIVTLTFDPNEVVLDMTNANYLNATNVETVKVNSYDYISQITFKVDAISSTTVRFYKVDVSENYEYPNASNISIIDFYSE